MKTFPYSGRPGVNRDGVQLDSDMYADGEWVRFYRGRPRKIGGYRAMTTLANGPLRALTVDSRRGANIAHLFSEWGVQRLQFSGDGAGNNIDTRTPVGFLPDDRLTWSSSVMYSSTGGNYAALIAAATPDLLEFDSDEGGRVYYGDLTTNEPLQLIEDENTQPLLVSGGVAVLQPFLFVYGSNGLIKNSQPNDFTPAGWDPAATGTLANEANVAGTKFVYGAPVRGGSASPAGLFWALDALVRVTFNAAQATWQYDTLTQPSTILSKKCVVEHDGKFFWIGTDRFLMYNGTVQEVPNTVNSNWFFDNLNYAMRNKVWGTKIARWKEIWWFYPRGNSTECNAAIIYNYQENTWYDAECLRSAGAAPQLFRFPVWGGAETRLDTLVLPTGVRLELDASAASGATTLTVDTSQLDTGMFLQNSAVPQDTTITVSGPTTVTLSNPTTAALTLGAELLFHTVATPFTVGETVTGPSGTGRVERTMYSGLNVKVASGTFAAGQTITGSLAGNASIVDVPYGQQLEGVFQHEFGQDKVVGQDVSAIRASITTRDFGFAAGAPYDKTAETADLMTRVAKIEPGFNQQGSLQVEVLGRSFNNDLPRVLTTETFAAETRFLSPQGAQERFLRLRVSSNERGGFFEQGQLQLGLEPGDARSSAPK